MPMNYQHIDPAVRELAKVRSTGLGDTSLLTDADALAIEQQVVVLKLRRAFANEHATSVVPNPDPDAALFADRLPTLDDAITAAETVRDRIVTVTSTDVSGVAQPILDANRAQAESDYHDAEWSMTNVPGLTQDQIDALQLKCDRAEREASVIDNWGA